MMGREQVNRPEQMTTEELEARLEVLAGKVVQGTATEAETQEGMAIEAVLCQRDQDDLRADSYRDTL